MSSSNHLKGLEMPKDKLAGTFGKVLKKIRNSKGVSQEKLAEKSHLDRTYISLLERGLRQPSLDTIFRLSSSLDIKPSELVKLTEEAKK
jgi:transcriptional regulator with XRE-family HTH domain